MKIIIKTEADMRWRKGDERITTIDSTKYSFRVEKVVIDSSRDHYEYELYIEQHWVEQ